MYLNAYWEFHLSGVSAQYIIRSNTWLHFSRLNVQSRIYINNIVLLWYTEYVSYAPSVTHDKFWKVVINWRISEVGRHFSIWVNIHCERPFFCRKMSKGVVKTKNEKRNVQRTLISKAPSWHKEIHLVTSALAFYTEGWHCTFKLG